MAAQRERSRRAVPHQWAVANGIPRSEFTGYRELTTETKVVGIRRAGQEVESASEGDEVDIFVERSPFYAESGGQIGDMGIIKTPSGQIRVEDTQAARTPAGAKPGGAIQRTVAVTATVVAIDASTHTVTLKGPRQTVALPVAKDIDLTKVKVGDQVGAVYQESFALTVEPAKKQ